MRSKEINILITGSEGFLAKNVKRNQGFNSNLRIYKFKKKTSNQKLLNNLKKCDLILHLAGENRSKKIIDFKKNKIKL